MRDELMRLTAREGDPRSTEGTRRRFAVTVERLVHGGFGLARTDSGIVLVNDMLPGESAEVEIVGKRSGTPVCAPREVTTRSDARRTPFCRYAGVCGGCDWQHIAYDEQVRIKKEILLDCLVRLGRIQANFPIETYCSPERRYRSRTQIKVDRKGGAMGFYRRKSNEVVRIDSCPLLIEALDDLLVRQTAILPHFPDGSTQLRAIGGAAGRVASSPVVPGMTEAATEVRVGDWVFPVEGNSFFQSNAVLLEKLAAWTSSRVGGGRFIDLYGGTGLFSIALHDRFETGTLIEIAEPLVAKARECFARNRVTNVKAVCQTVERFVARAQRGSPPDCVLVDPPRPGLTRKAREGLRALAPSTILYVSCNPATLARDAGFLTGASAYEIEAGALFDLYPQTHHIEAALLLRRAGTGTHV